MGPNARDKEALVALFGDYCNLLTITDFKAQYQNHQTKTEYSPERLNGQHYTWPQIESHTEHYQNWLPTLCALANPKVVVETGVDSGLSTAMLLKAKPDTLYSIDCSFETDDDIVQQVDWLNIVPTNEIHNRLIPIAEMSQTVLPKLNFSAHRPLDLFLHDSDHSYECQSFEYTWAWKTLRPGGLLCSDDYTWGDGRAWKELVTAAEQPWYALGAMAVIRKPGH